MTPDELVNPDEIKSHDEFDTSIGEKLGPAASAEDFESDPEIITPTLDRYKDDEWHQNNMLMWMTLYLRLWAIILGRI